MFSLKDNGFRVYCLRAVSIIASYVPRYIQFIVEKIFLFQFEKIKFLTINQHSEKLLDVEVM